MTKGNEPAYPSCVWVGDSHAGHTQGLTKREEFAKAAMQGILAGGWNVHEFGASYLALQHANAMLAELEKGK